MLQKIRKDEYIRKKSMFYKYKEGMREVPVSAKLKADNLKTPNESLL